MGKNGSQMSTDWIETRLQSRRLSAQADMESLWPGTAACLSRALYPQGPSSIPKISDCDLGCFLSLHGADRAPV